MEKFAIGVLVGAMGGAILAANSLKMRTLVKKGQEEVKEKLDEMMDEKLKTMQCGCGGSGVGGEKSGENRERDGAPAKKADGQELSDKKAKKKSAKKAVKKTASEGQETAGQA